MSNGGNDTGDRFFAGVVDTSEKPIADDVDTGEKTWTPKILCQTSFNSVGHGLVLRDVYTFYNII